MPAAISDILDDVRARFAHVDRCPFEGDRVFFENAGGALTLKSVVETSARFAAIPDNQGRDNPASAALGAIIDRARADIALLFNAPGGTVFVGESGTELLFRLVATACLGVEPCGVVLGSSVEHPATRSARARWAAVAGFEDRDARHDDARGLVTPAAYGATVSPETRVATVLHTSPVTGMANDLPGIVAAIRDVAPEAFVIVDGIQHASHGAIDIAAAGADGYVISPYKMFSRHGYGVAWISDRLAVLPHDRLVGGPEGNWDLGTRDTGAFATMSDVVAYLDWLGGRVSNASAPRARLEAAGAAIRAHEAGLVAAMLHGTAGLAGLSDLPGVGIIGRPDDPAREGLVSFWAEGRASADIVAGLREDGIRVHIRRDDHYSGNILRPLGRRDCVRVSLAHYNTSDEVARFLASVRRLLVA